ncbi:16S rRNA (guanine(966)-N(2))-methyltransferase RsmD [Mycoplasma procyoni]|uniref:16S rRNA (guanine(966)-N(2))-methyltransferase RsmD n=1 Tax=Mycoplasma procyoni TaxID=568784 RepID=UPI00197C826B|nr:16S rRNA (guanine(966)-N(2))-methyltransferase RsmD [Mycoplasma procyoni]MBN3534432.1 16S rRNA (guanine(966)-N(2))-methyltransferase RsmD [Mycoplasma procyoni]
MLRIIAGSLRGRRIEQPDLKIVRPTTDKTREAVFSSIQFEIEGSSVLDLFAGSGAISLEFISRGAKEVYASEKNRKIYSFIKQEIEKIKVDNLKLFNVAAVDLIRMNTNKKFDFVFIDPPYENKELIFEALELIKAHDILQQTGKIIIETNDQKLDFSNFFNVTKIKKYGKTIIYFLER